MVVGAAAAAIGNQACEASAEDQGFLLYEDIGYSGIHLDDTSPNLPVISTSHTPAAPFIKSGDVIKAIGEEPVATLEAAKIKLFGKQGSLLELTVNRNEESVGCSLVLAEAPEQS